MTLGSMSTSINKIRRLATASLKDDHNRTQSLAHVTSLASAISDNVCNHDYEQEQIIPPAPADDQLKNGQETTTLALSKDSTSCAQGPSRNSDVARQEDDYQFFF